MKKLIICLLLGSIILSSCVNDDDVSSSINSNLESAIVENDTNTISNVEDNNESEDPSEVIDNSTEVNEGNDENNSEPFIDDDLYGINNSNKGVFLAYDGNVISSSFDYQSHKTILMDVDNKQSILSFGNGYFTMFLYNLFPYKGDVIGLGYGFDGDQLYIMNVESKSARILYESLSDLPFFSDLYVVNDEIYLIISGYPEELYRLCKYDVENDSLHVIYEHSGEIGGLIHNDGWLYFVGVSDKTIYRINLESNLIETVLEISGEYLGILYFIDNNLYYSTTSGVYKYSLKTGESEMILEKVSDGVIVVGDNIFYTDSEDDYKLYYYDKSTNATTLIADDYVREIAIIDNWIYCSAVSPERTMYTFRINIVDFQRDDLAIEESE